MKTHLPELINWQKKFNYPFIFNTEVSINAAEDEELIDMMTDAGFTSCFVGIETPEKKSLYECGKKQNISVNMVEAVKKEVSGGFIKVIFKLGFLQASGKYCFWKMIFLIIRNYLSKLVLAITLAVYGFNFRKIAELL